MRRWALLLVATMVLASMAAPADARKRRRRPPSPPPPRTMLLVTHENTEPTHGLDGFGLQSYSMSAGGRFVAFEYHTGATPARQPVPFYDDETGGFGNIFLYDRQTQGLTLVTKKFGGATPGQSANDASGRPTISADGRFIVYSSNADDLVDGFSDPVFGSSNLFIYEVSTGINRLISHRFDNVTTAGDDRTIQADFAAISTDGSKVAFHSEATDLVENFVPGNGDDESDLYLYDTVTQTNTLVSRAHDNPLGGSDDAVFAFSENRPQISADGRFVAYTSTATNLVPGFQNTNVGFADIYLFDAIPSTNTLVSHAAGAPNVGGNGETLRPSLSANGMRIAYETSSTNLINGFIDNNTGDTDVFVWTRTSNSTRLVSFSATQGALHGAGPFGGFNGSVPVISDNGKVIAYESDADDLISGFQDSNVGQDELYLWSETKKKKRNGKKKIVFRNRLITPHLTGVPGQGTFGIPTLVALSGNGRQVFYQTNDNPVGPDFVDANGNQHDMFTFDAATGKATLMSRSIDSPTQTGDDGSSTLPSTGAISTDGWTVLFRSDAQDLIDSFDDGNGAQFDLYRFGP